MKNKKGFTLLELLAILIVLALLTIITIPVIGNVMKSAKKNTATESAYGYIEALKEHMATYSMENDISLNGTYVVNNGNISGYNLESQTVKTKGTKPTNGYIVYSEDIIQEGCLTIGEYKIMLNNKKVESTEEGECETVTSSEPIEPIEPIDITNGLRERVLTLYSNEIASASNYFIVYRNNFGSADLIIYPSQNYNFQMRVTEPSNTNTNIPYFDLHIIGSYTAYAGITMESSATSTYSGSDRYFSGIQTSSPNNVSIEMPKYPANINDYQIYKNNFGKVPTTENYRRINLDEVLTLPSSYNNTPCRDYMVLTYSGNAQFYCITGDATFTYDTTNKRLNFNYNNGHMYRYKYNTNNWNIVFDADVNWNSLNNYDYMNNDILDIILLSTFDIKDANNNIVYPKNTTIEKLTTNYVAQ